MSEPQSGARAALIVATGTYTDPALAQMRAPAADASALAEVLADPGIGGYTVTTVLDRPAHEIRLAIADFVADRGTRDLLLVYLSCHGVLDERRRLHLTATDSRQNRLAATGLESAWVVDQLENCRARSQVLILDACFSGAFARGAKGDTNIGVKDRFLGHGRGRVVLTASTATEYAFETTSDRGSSEPTAAFQANGSVFTTALVNGLRTGAADLDQDGRVSVDDAYAYVFDHVKAAGAAQTPQRWLYGVEGGILLARNPNAGTRITPALRTPRAPSRSASKLDTREDTNGPRETVSGATRQPARADGKPDRASRHMPQPASTRTTPAPTPAPQPRKQRPRPRFRLLHTRSGATGEVIRLTFSPDASLLACATQFGIWLWNAATGNSLGQVDHGASRRKVVDIAFSPDGLLAVLTEDHRVQFWDPRNSTPLFWLRDPANEIQSIAISSEGLLATGGTNGGVRVWAPTDAAARITATAVKTTPNPDTPNPSNNSSSYDLSTLWLPRDRPAFSPRPKKPATFLVVRHELAGSSDILTFNPTGNLLACAGYVDEVAVWNLADTEQRRVLRGHTNRVTQVAFSSEGRHIVTADEDGDLLVQDLISGQERRRIPGVHAAQIAFAPDNLMAIPSRLISDGCWDGPTGSRIADLPDSRISRITFSPNGSRAATSTDYGRIRIWEYEFAPK